MYECLKSCRELNAPATSESPVCSCLHLDDDLADDAALAQEVWALLLDTWNWQAVYPALTFLVREAFVAVWGAAGPTPSVDDFSAQDLAERRHFGGFALEEYRRQNVQEYRRMNNFKAGEVQGLVLQKRLGEAARPN